RRLLALPRRARLLLAGEHGYKETAADTDLDPKDRNQDDADQDYAGDQRSAEDEVVLQPLHGACARGRIEELEVLGQHPEVRPDRGERLANFGERCDVVAVERAKARLLVMDAAVEPEDHLAGAVDLLDSIAEQTGVKQLEMA